MGHKVNPDIFRFGVSKKWSYQLRTNKNFIKNLFLFKFLKNLFMNYNIPLFNFRYHRNRMLNDKLIFRGEKQVAKSPFIIRNILFSHVLFGMLNDQIYIESFFIDSGMKKVVKNKKLIVSRFLPTTKEYNFWDSGFYKKNWFQKISLRKKKDYDDLKPRISLKILFRSRRFRSVSKKSKIYVVRTIKNLDRQIFRFARNYKYKNSTGLRIFFRTLPKRNFFDVLRRGLRKKTSKKKFKKRKFKINFSDVLDKKKYFVFRIKKKRKKYSFFLVCKKEKEITGFF